jgi:hypothetical protein
MCYSYLPTSSNLQWHGKPNHGNFNMKIVYNNPSQSRSKNDSDLSYTYGPVIPNDN